MEERHIYLLMKNIEQNKSFGGMNLNGLDKIMKVERKQRYKDLRKLRKARDMATKYVNKKILLSTLDTIHWHMELDYHFTSSLAREIVRVKNSVRPPAPPSRQVKAIK